MRQNYADWLYRQDVRLFFWFNHRLNFSALDRVLGMLTHLGGAFFTILMTFSVALFAPESWSRAGGAGPDFSNGKSSSRCWIKEKV
ncbi:hypothetical protein [Paenibacillus larvae]|uniref:hypothetical protein n=1 Tax=Paenibacillus larvae TaxID=1464 RepID=UPI002892CF95|nr:hypothetical protein [Paenibacillus larvae]